ncbi:open rectifier potassium channel protein 1 isoform X2 [Periplaneta americana]|uniref:open rectifier potassium channel protein 1 isoform X2 n=1 Tax=Periplaneta americana TaxID=6978 RepID=UPI0037E7377B
MMSKKQWLALLALFVLYLLLGAALFHHIESELEVQRRQQERAERIEIHALLSKHYAAGEPASQAQLLQKLSEYCGRPMSVHPNGSDAVDFEPFVWDFYNSVFFVITVVSTIGYGNLSPSSALGRLLMILYALVGIPMNGIVLATLAEFFSTALLKVHRRYKTKRSETRAGLVADIVLYLIPGFVVFIFLPTGVFMHFEGWTFDESLYYAFVTLTTIGFGDFVAGQTDKGRDSGVLFVLYKALLLVWIVFGLGYLVMLLGFITRAMRSKRMARLEHRLAANLKHTQSKLWTSLTRDVAYLRRALNELYVMKLRPVYKDDEAAAFPARTRSSSEPTLGGLPAPGTGVWRRRANSETAASLRLPRVMSDSDLQRIDRDATFKGAATLIEPGELLAHVVSSLGADEGVQGFSDADILAGEGGWSLGGEPLRGRAASEVRVPAREPPSDPAAEWTWSGAQPSRRVHELMRARHKSLVPPDVSARRPSIFQLAAARLKRRHKAKSIGDLEEGLRPEEHHRTMHPALEETSLADFLRAVNSLQHRVATPPPGSLTSLFTPPTPTPARDRRMSLRPTRRASLHPSARRFSVRPVTSTLPSPPPPPPPPIRLLAPHLFARQNSDPPPRRK